jgi:GH15 family glucan-1,4-alpha-glucosidase
MLEPPLSPGARIVDYAFIGNCITAALVSRDGSIDWLCWPRFDSSACFAALLGNREHGCWRLAPKDAARAIRKYHHGTLILITRYDTDGGSIEVTEFMPLGLAASHVVRLIRGISGSVTMSSELVLRFEYGSAVPWVEALEDGTIRAICGPEMVLLRSPVPHHGEDHATVAEFTVHAGDCIPLVLSYCPSHQALGPWLDAQKALQETEAAWRAWSDRCAPAGRLTEVVKQSLLVLKGLNYAPTGGIVAAATTSLPEQ